MFSNYAWNTKIYPMEEEFEEIHNMREALIGNSYFYLSYGNPVIPYGTFLGVLTYKRFREPANYRAYKKNIGSYICKFTNFNGEFRPNEFVQVQEPTKHWENLQNIGRASRNRGIRSRRS